MELFMIRHSIAEGNLKREFLGRKDDPLASCGVELALSKKLVLPRVERVYTSPMLRARTTADIIWPDTQKSELCGLREMDFGIFDGRTDDELQKDKIYTDWLAQGEWEGYPGGETFEDARRRCTAAFLTMVRDATERGLSKIGSVMHGGSIMMIMESFTDIRLNYTDKLVKNCEGFRMQVSRINGATLVTQCVKI